MKIAMTGSSGLIGRRVATDLRADGHTVVPMVRSGATVGQLHWKPAGPLDPAALRGYDAVVHLAGEPIGGGRWTAKRKERILRSRTEGTTTVAEAVAKADGGPTVLISASAMGYYGNRGDELLEEDAGPGDDFLAKVVVEWEAAAEPARTAGIRVVHPRFGIVLDPNGGALQKLLPLFKAGLGGRLGSGEQWWSWVAIDDVSRMIRWALTDDDAKGPYNVTAPNPTTNAEFTEVLGDVLGRPTLLPVPAFGPRLLLGELADALVFNSQRLMPAALDQAGFTFEFPHLASALRHILGR